MPFFVIVTDGAENQIVPLLNQPLMTPQFAQALVNECMSEHLCARCPTNTGPLRERR